MKQRLVLIAFVTILVGCFWLYQKQPAGEQSFTIQAPVAEESPPPEALSGKAFPAPASLPNHSSRRWIPEETLITKRRDFSLTHVVPPRNLAQREREIWLQNRTEAGEALQLFFDAPRSISAQFTASIREFYDVPASWFAHFGIGGDLEEALYLDTDGDGHLNWQEYAIGSDPTNALSTLNLRIEGNTLRWNSFEGRRYHLMRGTDLEAFLEVDTVSAPEDSYVVPHPSVPRTFYRIELELVE